MGSKSRGNVRNVDLQELLFADDIGLVAKSGNKLQECLKIYQKEIQRINMEINIRWREIEQVKSYNYLDTFIEENKKIGKELNH